MLYECRKPSFSGILLSPPIMRVPGKYSWVTSLSILETVYIWDTWRYSTFPSIVFYVGLLLPISVWNLSTTQEWGDKTSNLKEQGHMVLDASWYVCISVLVRKGVRKFSFTTPGGIQEPYIRKVFYRQVLANINIHMKTCILYANSILFIVQIL